MVVELVAHLDLLTHESGWKVVSTNGDSWRKSRRLCEMFQSRLRPSLLATYREYLEMTVTRCCHPRRLSIKRFERVESRLKSAT